MAEETSSDMRVVKLCEVERFIKDCMMSAGAPEDHSIVMAQVLAEADRRGHLSHGVNRISWYVDDLVRNSTDGAATPVILKESAATAWVDGRNGLGPVVGKFCMQLAIRKAHEAGVGLVTTKGSNHFGIAGWYSMMALEEQMIGVSFTNTSPFASPPRAKTAALGTNPLSVAAPAEAGDSFVLDMATTVVALGKIEVKQRSKMPIPFGWALDETGAVTTDADAAMRSRCLMPLGGLESGYKGYGLMVLVEVLCGVLAGAPCGPDIRQGTSDESRPYDLAHTFLAIDPSCFAPGFEGRLTALLGKLRGLEPANKDAPVLIHGDPEREQSKITDEQGVSYHIGLIEAAEEMATRLNVKPMQCS